MHVDTGTASGRDIPVIDVAGLRSGHHHDRVAIARAIDTACREVGFFALAGHGVDTDLLARMEVAAHEFFALPVAAKERVAMVNAGRAWRGWFPLGGELTAGVPDGKEGYYFGVDHPSDHPLVEAGVALHGQNLFPDSPEDLGPAVAAWIDAMTGLAADVAGCVAMGLGLDEAWFEDNVTHDPTALFRIFRYPPDPTFTWGVAEHTDYGLLTLLAQDGNEGLEVKLDDAWVEVPADPELIVCNIGDMLERLTAGAYRSTPHRVRNRTANDRLSFPFFFDPSWDAEVVPLPLGGSSFAGAAVATGAGSPPVRWDDANPVPWTGRYGDYLTAKVARVFPELFGATGEESSQ